MRFRSIDRPADAFQQPLDLDLITRLSRRGFRESARIDAIEELPWGSYNTTYRVAFDSADPVVLRVAPEPRLQFRAEHALMRNEYAATPYLAVLGDLIPRTLFADFTHQLIGRDYLVQTVLPGVPAPEAMGRYPRPSRSAVFRQLGEIARRVHDVPGPAFGPVAGPTYDTWSAALIGSFHAIAEDVKDAGLDPTHPLDVAAAVDRHRAEFDDVEPRLLHGDGWTGNVLVDPTSSRLPVTGICDGDRAEWGDRYADWAMQRAMVRPGTERDAFWDGYGEPRPVPDGIRQVAYHARYLLGLRLDQIRADRSGDPRAAERLAENHDQVARLLTDLPR